jgi:hypothetical protein
MTRLLLALALGAMAVGCTGIHPVGPMAKMMGPGPGKGAPGKAKGKDKDEAADPITIPAVRPTPPLNTMGPEDVSPDDPHASLHRLQQELEAEGQRTQAAPVTAEISRIKGGVRQE